MAQDNSIYKITDGSYYIFGNTWGNGQFGLIYSDDNARVRIVSSQNKVNPIGWQIITNIKDNIGGFYLNREDLETRGLPGFVSAGNSGGTPSLTTLPIDIDSASPDSEGILLSFDTANMGAKKEQHIVLIGSSTTQGTSGLSDISESWGEIIKETFSNYIIDFSYENLGLNGTTTYHIAPTGNYVEGRPSPNTDININKAVDNGASIVLIASPSNDAYSSYSASEILTNWNKICNFAKANGLKVFHMGSNPRALVTSGKEILYDVEKGLINEHPDTIIPLLDVFSDANQNLDDKWDSGDSIHHNRLGHLRIAKEMISRVKDYIDSNSFDKIIIERSVGDTNNFSEIGYVEFGNFIDYDVVEGINYYYRTKVISNIGGISDYSNIVQAAFAETLPIITTSSISNISNSEATFNGEILALGGNVTAHGFVYNTVGNPTLGDNLVDKGAAISTGPFSSNIIGLTSGETYYVKSFATNSAGTSYGNEESFVAEDTLETTIKINFSDTEIVTPTYYSANGISQSIGVSYVDLTDINGVSTGIGFIADGENLGNGTGWGHSTGGNPAQNTGGEETGNDSGAFVDDALKSYWFTSNSLYPNGALASLVGLNDSKSYSIKIMPSRDTTGSRITSVTIGGVTKSQEAIGNTDTPIEFLNLSPISGVIDMHFICSNSEYAYLNAMEIVVS